MRRRIARSARVAAAPHLDLDGNVVRNLQDAQRRFISLSGALEHADQLYIGSVAMDALGRLSLAE